MSQTKVKSSSSNLSTSLGTTKKPKDFKNLNGRQKAAIPSPCFLCLGYKIIRESGDRAKVGKNFYIWNNLPHT